MVLSKYRRCAERKDKEYRDSFHHNLLDAMDIDSVSDLVLPQVTGVG
jgi:hypothetical protein